MYSNRASLTVDLSAITHNWQVITEHAGADVLCGVVVKANAYGLGVSPVATALSHVGCRHFFVAHIIEGIELRSLLGANVSIYVLLGFADGEEPLCAKYDLIPIISSVAMFERWLEFAVVNSARGGASKLRAGIKVNTGMTRLGLDVPELQSLMSFRAKCLHDAGVELVMSHLACADDEPHPLNQKQIHLFQSVVSAWQSTPSLPKFKFSLTNSAGVLLHRSSHFDLVRPGIALYGGDVGGGQTVFGGALKHVVNLMLPIMQLRHVSAGETVGYGATFLCETDRVVAVVAGGYADGLFRFLGNNAWGYLNGVRVPLIGRVSMDSCMFDVSEVYSEDLHLETLSIEILGDFISINELASRCGTVGYEILTSLGTRFQRSYVSAI